jgi:hypothetical protein
LLPFFANLDAMNYDQNADILYSAKPPYKLKGISYQFTDETNYLEPVSLEDFKDYAGIDWDIDDSLVSKLLTSSRVATEKYLLKSLGIRSVLFKAQECYENYELSWAPVEEVVTEGFTVFSNLLVEGGKDIEVEFITNASFVDETIKEAIMMKAMDSFNNRGRYLTRYRETGELVDRWKDLLRPYRKMVYP